MNPTRFRVFLLLAVALCLSTSAARGESVDSLIAKGDPLDQRLQANEALEYYLPALKLDPDNVALLGRIARQYRHLMSDASDKKEKLRLGHISLEYAKKAADLSPNNAEAQLSPAISYGKMLPYMSSGDQVETSPRIKAAVDRTLQLDPQNDNAWHILGRWNRVLADISGLKRMLAGVVYGQLPTTSNEEAERCLKKAISLNPDRLMHSIELGHIYVQMGRKEEARKYLEQGLSMPDKEKGDPEMKAVGRALLEQVGNSSAASTVRR
ncbi:hypothetical protein BH18VER2_BH18VER2_08430 [soil metagenome]